MKANEIKVGSQITSPNGYVWVIIKKYTKDFILIRSCADGTVKALSKGQYRMFKIRQIHRDKKEKIYE